MNLPGKIDGVIVYRGQALVTRTIDLKLPAGSHEVIVGNLPEKIVAESLYSQAPENVTILSVRYRQRAVQEDTREEVKQVDLLIEQIETKIRLAKGDEEHLGRQLARLEKLTDFTAAAEKGDLNRGMLQYDPLEKTATFIEGKADEYQKKLVAVRESLLQLAKDLELAKRKRAELAAGYSRTEREAVIFMNKSNPAQSIDRADLSGQRGQLDAAVQSPFHAGQVAGGDRIQRRGAPVQRRIVGRDQPGPFDGRADAGGECPDPGSDEDRSKRRYSAPGSFVIRQYPNRGATGPTGSAAGRPDDRPDGTV